MDAFRSLVLLTAGSPQLRIENIQRRLSRWTGLVFGQNKSDPNFIAGQDTVFVVKLHRQYVFMVTLLHRPYWETEDINPYKDQAEAKGDPDLAQLISTCQGAIVVDSISGPNGVTATTYLVKLAAAVMEVDAPAFVVPASHGVQPVDDVTRKGLARANSLADLAPFLLTYRVQPASDFIGLMCVSRGMELFELPNLALRCTDSNADKALATVQSVAAYQVQLGRPVPLGETLAVPDVGDCRIASPDPAQPDILLLELVAG